MLNNKPARASLGQDPESQTLSKALHLGHIKRKVFINKLESNKLLSSPTSLFRGKGVKTSIEHDTILLKFFNSSKANSAIASIEFYFYTLFCCCFVQFS